MSFDPHLPTGQVFVSLLPFRRSSEDRPSFRLKSPKDNDWIHLFKEQFEALWEEAEPVNLAQKQAPSNQQVT